MKPLLTHLIRMAAAILLAGCVLDIPNTRDLPVAGGYFLEQWEDGETYRLYARPVDNTQFGGGLLAGTIEKIGWNEKFIMAFRTAMVRHEGDGWMIVEVNTRRIWGPLSDTELTEKKKASAEIATIVVYPADQAWKRLKP